MYRGVGDKLPRKRPKIKRGPYANFRSLNFIFRTTENPEGRIIYFKKKMCVSWSFKITIIFATQTRFYKVCFL